MLGTIDSSLLSSTLSSDEWRDTMPTTLRNLLYGIAVAALFIALCHVLDAAELHTVPYRYL